MSGANLLRAALVTLAAALVAALALVAAAGATRTVKIPSSITISSYVYFGKVKSPNANCLGGRKVVLEQKGHGALGHATSSKTGAWKIDPSTLHYAGAVPFKLFAMVKPSSQGTAGTIYKCSGATSKTITIKGG